MLQWLLFVVIMLWTSVLHAAADDAVKVTLDVNDHVQAASSRPVDDHFISFTSDWWTNKEGWGPGTSILTINLDDQRIVAAARALAPAIWRIGGTRADRVWYQMDEFDPNANGIVEIPTMDDGDNGDGGDDGGNGDGGDDKGGDGDVDGDGNDGGDIAPQDESSQAPTSSPTHLNMDGGVGGFNYTNDNSTDPDDTMTDWNYTNPGGGDDVGGVVGDGGNMTSDNNGTRFLQEDSGPIGGGDEDYDPCQPGFCLTGTRWYQIMKFAWKTGVQIVFTINYSLHTQSDLSDASTLDSQEWDATQARAFLEFTKQHAPPATIFGFELGNEVTHKNRITNLQRLGRAYEALKGMVNEIWSDVSPSKRPKLLGPAGEASSLNQMMPYIESYVDVVTFHKYQHHGGDGLLASAVQRGFYWAPSKYSREVAQANGAEVVWIGEGAMASDSGQTGITDTFLSSLWMANALGSMAATHPVPISTFCRQTLVGGYYGILAPDTHEPYPDFYLMRLWKHVVGTQALEPVGVSSTGRTSDLLVHAFCGKENAQLVVIVVNVNSELYFDVSIVGEQKDVYLLQGTTGGLSQTVNLNGIQQGMNENGIMTDLLPKTIGSDETVAVPSHSIAFVVVNDSTVALCGGIPRSLPPNQGNKYEEDNLSTAALSVIIAAAALVFVLGLIICCCRGRDRRRKMPHSMLAQDDLFMNTDDGLL